METKIYETCEAYKESRGKWSLDLKSGESITIWGEDTIKIIPRASNSVQIVSE